MIRIKRLTIKDFMSFANATIEFPYSGLFFIKGINHDNGENSAIEAGKTNLLESMLFCLFGKTTRNLTQADYVRWGCSDFFIELEFYSGAIIRRTLNTVEFISPEGKTYSGKKKTSVQAVINSYLGFDFKTFFHTVYTGYMYKSFIDLTPSERLKTFTSLFGLDILDKCASYAKKKSAEYEALLSKCEIEIASLSGQLKQLSESYEHKIIEWEQKKEAEYKQLLHEKKILEDKLNTAHNLLVKKETKISETKKKYKLDIEYSDLKEQANDIQEQISTLEEKKKEIEIETALVKKDIDTIDKRLQLFKDNKCPTCERPFTGDENILVSLNAERSKLQNKIKNNLAKIDDIELRLSVLYGKLNKINDDLDRYLQYERFIQKLETEVTRYKTYIEEWTKEMENLKQKMRDLNNKENPYRELENKRIQKLGEVKKKLQKHVSMKDNLSAAQEAYDFWIDNFRTMKLSLFGDLRKAYEVRFNSYLSLFGSQANVSLLNETDKLDIEFCYQGHKCRLDNFSTGGTQLLRLSAEFALADLLKYKVSGKIPAMLVLDEPFANLSIRERQKFMGYIYGIKNTKQIFFVEHAIDVQQENFDYIITVSKKNGISSVEIN